MLLGGDELGRTQQGNNNAYCQDNELSWFDWDTANVELLEFTRRLIRLRQDHPVFRRRRWFQGRPIRGSGERDLVWFKPDGEEMSEEDWANGFAKSLALYLNGEGIAHAGPRGERVRDDSFYLVCNAHWEPIEFMLPRAAARRALAGGARYRADLPRGWRDPRRRFVTSRDRAVARAPAPRRMRERCGTSHSRRTTTGPWLATDAWTTAPSPRWNVCAPPAGSSSW